MPLSAYITRALEAVIRDTTAVTVSGLKRHQREMFSFETIAPLPAM